MRPDYPHKTFRDKRFNYILLLESLAMDAPAVNGAGINN